MDTTPSRTETQALTREEKIKALKIKIEALEFAALNPEIECNGIHGHHIHATSEIERCCDEALALVDEVCNETLALVDAVFEEVDHAS